MFRDRSEWAVATATEKPGGVQFDRGIYFDYPADFQGHTRAPRSGSYHVRWETRLEVTAQPTVLADSNLLVTLPELAHSSADRAVLEIRWGIDGQYRRKHPQRAHIRFGVYNASDRQALNVEVCLFEIQPQPRWAGFDPDLPYRVRRADTGLEAGDHSINPHQDVLFDMLWFWMSVPEGPGLMVDGIDTKTVLPTVPIDRMPLHAAFPMQDGEHWHLTYRISAANADEQIVKFFVERIGNEVQATRV